MNDICIIKYVLGSNRTQQINCNAATLKKSFFNWKINVRTGILDPVNMGKDTKTDFLSQLLRTLLGIEYLAHLAHMTISCFAYMTEKLLKGAGVALFGFSFV